MGSGELSAVVIGAGWAGEGHTRALQHCGVEVTAICARELEAVQAVAARLGVPGASVDWRKSLVELNPDIVALATPAALRGEVVEVAAELGCQLLCDKPLAVTEKQAGQLYQTVARAGIKHAYAATQRYDPSVSWAAELLAQETVGALQAIQITASAPFLTPLTAWSWWDDLSAGGGILNNGFSHQLSMLERMLQGELIAVAGEARVSRHRAPVAPALHDFRQRMALKLSEDEAARLTWRECDAETAFAALLQFRSALAAEPIPVMVRSDLAASYVGPTNGWTFYGDQGVLLGQGVFALTLSRYDGVAAEPLPTPQRLAAELPQVGSAEENKWGALVRDFVADIRGEAHRPYLTFAAGWRYQAAIEAIRGGEGFYLLDQVKYETDRGVTLPTDVAPAAG